MPRFFFHVRSAEEGYIQDKEGAEFHDLSAAREDAERGVEEMLAEHVHSGTSAEQDEIEIADERGVTVQRLLLKDWAKKLID